MYTICLLIIFLSSGLVLDDPLAHSVGDPSHHERPRTLEGHDAVAVGKAGDKTRHLHRSRHSLYMATLDMGIQRPSQETLLKEEEIGMAEGRSMEDEAKKSKGGTR